MEWVLKEVESLCAYTPELHADLQQTRNSSKTFREQEFWGRILPQKQRMFGPSQMMKKRVVFRLFKKYPVPHNHHYQYCYKSLVQSTIRGSINNLLINTQSMDQSTTCGSIHNIRINPQSVNKTTSCGSIHKVWINPKALDESTKWRSFQNPWINPQYMDQSKICESIHNMWISVQS